MTGRGTHPLLDEVSRAALAPLHLIVESVDVTPAGRRRVVRIAVDTDLSGLEAGDDSSVIAPITLDEVADATRAISAALDESDLLGAAPYTLEVTSPGVSRPLTCPRHFRRNVGRLVELVLADGGAAQGRIVAADDRAVHLVPVEAETAEPTPYAFDDITRARVQVEFGRGEIEDESEN